MFAKSTVTQSMIDAVNKVLDKEIVLGEMLAEDANNPHQAAITHHHTELMKAHQVGNKEAIAHHADELNKAKDRFRTHRAANEPAHVPPKPGSIEHYYATARRTNDSVEIDTTGKEIVAEGLPQTLRKVVPGYAKREIDKKMDAGKFGKTDADKDANFQRYKKIQDKLKEQGVAEKEESRYRMTEGFKDALKKSIKAVGKALGGPDDEGHKKDLQRKMGIPQTGKPSMAKQNEEVEQIDEISKASLHSYATAAHTKYDTLRNKSDSASTEKKSKLAQGIKKANQKMYPPVQHKPEPKVDMSSPSAYYKSKGSGYVGDSVELNGTPLEEKSTLKGNQKKIDKNHNGKIDGQDFKILRGQKKANEEITTDTLVGQMKGGKSNAFKSFKSTLKGDIDKTPAAKEGKPTAQHKVVKAEEVQQEGWDDMVKSAKDAVKSGPKPSGGSGIKQGSRYGGSKQKDEPESTEKKTVKENKGPESDTVPFVRNDSAPISVARDTAQRAMKRIKTEMMGKIAN